MKRTPVRPSNHPQPGGHYTHGIITEGGRLLHVAGQTALNAEGQIAALGDAYGQARQCYENLRRVVEAAGGRMADIAKITVFVTRHEYREAVSRARKEAFPGDAPPASTFLVVSALAHPDFLVEVEATVPLD